MSSKTSANSTGKSLANGQPKPSINSVDIKEGVSQAIYYVTTIGIAYTVSYYIKRYIQSLLEDKHGASQEIARKLQRPELASLVLNSYEARIGRDAVVALDELTTTFNDIGGMEEELEDVADSIVLPMQISKNMKDLSSIIACPTGVLLFGRPGTGKTLTARALAKECNASFLQVNSSMLLDKWMGESDKLVAALFNLARKLAPTIIFIDEIDSLLRSRNSMEHNQAMSTVQAVLLSEWDGLKSAIEHSHGPIIVVGATNRPGDIDSAFLRRLPVLIKTKTPSLEDRVDIIRKMLSKERLAPDVDIQEIAMNTDGFTGSELREVVRAASVHRVKNLLESYKKLGSENNGKYDSVTMSNMASSQAPLTMADFHHALRKTQKSEDKARDYWFETQTEDVNKQLDPIREALKNGL